MTMPIETSNADLAEAMRTVAVNGAFNASRALSKWFRRGVRLTSGGFESVPITELSHALGDPDDAVATVRMPLGGDVAGDIVLAFPEAVALRLVDEMIQAPAGTSTGFNELECSCLQETGNIVASAFANSLASWLQLDITPQSPAFIHDLAGAIIQPLLIEYAAQGDNAFIARSEFDFDHESLEWRFMMLPSAAALALMNRKCGGDEVRRHALQTIAVNGAFNASRALSKWLRRGVKLHTEGFVRVPLREACSFATGDEPMVALHTRLSHHLHGHTLMLLPPTTALALVDAMTQSPLGTTQMPLDELSRSCLQETGNIVTSAFINSWSKWLDIHAEPGPPDVLVDLPEAILETVLVEQAMVHDEVFMAKAEFSIDGKWLEWLFYLLPTPSSLRLIETSCD